MEIEKAGKDIVFLMDVASSEFCGEVVFIHLKGEGKNYTSKELVEFYESICQRYPIVLLKMA